MDGSVNIRDNHHVLYETAFGVGNESSFGMSALVARSLPWEYTDQGPALVLG